MTTTQKPAIHSQQPHWLQPVPRRGREHAAGRRRFESLCDGVVSKIFDRLPDATWVYPGHGNDTTLGAERPHLTEWRERGW